MAIYAIGDLHLSFQENKPMSIFGDNWGNHEEKIKKDWLSKVNEEDLVILPGDFSWAMDLKNTYLAFNKQVESNLFEGTIYSFKNGIKKVFKTCNPVEIELMTNAIDDVMEISITYEGDGLLLDFVNKTILDADDPKATDIYSYKMDLRKGGITWQN